MAQPITIAVINANRISAFDWNRIFLRNKNRIGLDIIGYFKNGTLSAVMGDLFYLSETLYYRMRQAEAGRWNIDFAWELFCEIKPFTNKVVATDIVRAIALWSGNGWFGDKVCRDIIHTKKSLNRFLLNEKRA